MKALQAKLAQYTTPQEAKAAGVYPYFRAISSEQDPEVIINGRRVLMFGSNCYTGLVNDPRIKEAAIEATRKYGTGCAGSPFLNGTLDLHKELEAAIADYIGKEDVMIYSTGFEVNLGVVSTLTGREDYIIWDEQDHASIIEGRRLSFSRQFKYRHNDMDSLEKQLQRCDPDKLKLIVTDSVFSMEGDVANVPEIVRLAEKYGAAVMVDEAHGIGVFGEGAAAYATTTAWPTRWTSSWVLSPRALPLWADSSPPTRRLPTTCATIRAHTYSQPPSPRHPLPRHSRLWR